MTKKKDVGKREQQKGEGQGGRVMGGRCVTKRERGRERERKIGVREKEKW